MKDEYIIINKTQIQQRIEELEKEKVLHEKVDIGMFDSIWAAKTSQAIDLLKEILSQSTPLIPEIEKAFTKGERYGWDTHKSISNIDEMKEKIKIQSLENYITNLKLDI